MSRSGNMPSELRTASTREDIFEAKCAGRFINVNEEAKREELELGRYSFIEVEVPCQSQNMQIKLSRKARLFAFLATRTSTCHCAINTH